jgi:hypothetical protein
MKIITPTHLGAALSLAMLGVPAAAQQNCSCGGGARLTEAEIGALLFNKTVCAKLGTDAWQEFHNGSVSGGRVIDYKLGPNDKVDPSKDMGSWQPTGGNGAQARVTYNYGSGGSYAYEVCRNGATVHFCGSQYGGRNILGATLKDGQQSCGF